MIKISVAQNEENPLSYVQQEPKFDTAPCFPGGSKAMMKYFEANIHYPEPEKTKCIQGNVLVKFDITKKGNIINVKGLNGVPGGPNFVKEAVRVIQNMSLWIPAVEDGKPVDSEYVLSVPFKLKKKKVTKLN